MKVFTVTPGNAVALFLSLASLPFTIAGAASNAAKSLGTWYTGTSIPGSGTSITGVMAYGAGSSLYFMNTAANTFLDGDELLSHFGFTLTYITTD